MSKRIFSSEQISELLKNSNIKTCSEKSITYHGDFKLSAVRQYRDEGLSATQIFKEAGFNLSLIGSDTPKESVRRWVKIVKKHGGEGLSEKRGYNASGRKAVLKNLTDHEKIKALELQNAYLKAENSFLVKLRAKQKR